MRKHSGFYFCLFTLPSPVGETAPNGKTADLRVCRFLCLYPNGNRAAASWRQRSCLSIFRRTAAAVWLAIEKEERLEAVTKEIYPEVARACGCSWMAVERSLRTSVDIVWRTSAPLLAQMARYPLQRKPSAGQFIEILAVYILRAMEAEKSQDRDAADVL